jgi:hypothetical protein
LGELDHARRGGEAVIDVVGSRQDVAAGGECRDLPGGVVDPNRHGGGVIGERGATIESEGGVDERDSGERGGTQPGVVVAEQREGVAQLRDLLVVADVDLVAADAGSCGQHGAGERCSTAFGGCLDRGRGQCLAALREATGEDECFAELGERVETVIAELLSPLVEGGGVVVGELAGRATRRVAREARLPIAAAKPRPSAPRVAASSKAVLPIPASPIMTTIDA